MDDSKAKDVTEENRQDMGSELDSIMNKSKKFSESGAFLPSIASMPLTTPQKVT